MKKTPKILPTFYKSKGTPIFRDTTALPFAKGGPLPEEPVNPVIPPSWNRPQLSPERIAALKELHGDSIFASANPNDLLFYDLNKDLIDKASSFAEFLDPSVKVGPSFTKQAATQDIKTRLSKQGYALDTKTGAYFKVPDEVRDLITKPEPEPLEELEPLRPEFISRNIPTQLSLPPQPEVLQYQMPGYMKSYNFPTVGRYTPLAAKAVQKATGYDRNFMEGYYDEEGNYVPGELENAREQNRVPQFQGASSLRDMFAQKAYQQALEETKSFANGGIIHFERSEYGSDAREHYDEGGPIYTYSKRPGSFYQRGADGAWMINNSSTGGQYVPIDDPTGQRTALLNKNAVVYNAPAQGTAKPVMNQAVWNKAQQQGERELAAKQFVANVHKQSGTSGLYMPDGSMKPQAVQTADWVPQAMMGAPIAAEALGAIASIPLGAGVNLGRVANAAGLVHGTTQVDDRYQDWQDVAAGNMDWKEAALKTGMTGLEMGAGAAELYPNIYRASLPGTSVESGKAFKTLYPQAQMMPSGYKTYGQTQYVSPVSVNKNFTWNFDDLKNIKSSEGLPEYMNPYLYSKEIMQKRSSPELDAYYKMKEVEGVADKLIKRKIDDRVYYDLNGNIVKTPSDNY